jgi:hypothetical protein
MLFLNLMDLNLSNQYMVSEDVLSFQRILRKKDTQKKRKKEQPKLCSLAEDEVYVYRIEQVLDEATVNLRTSHSWW